jgi:Tol biopolymer transport system component/DNA-binding winged helix-turn-helix (wHTH) protein
VPQAPYQFGDFELDRARFELRRGGQVVKLERIPMELLILLAGKDGAVVSRQEIVDRLWGKDVFVDTEHGINTAIRKIRAALHEDAERPKYVLTVQGKGYRFAASTPASGNRNKETVNGHEVSLDDQPPKPDSKPVPKPRRLVLKIALVAAGAALLLLGVTLVTYRFWARSADRYTNLKVRPFTTLPGIQAAPSFSPDGNEVVYWWSGSEDRAGSAGLHIKQVGNEQAVQLTEDASFAAPAWSPDGRTIAFSRSSPQDNGIYLVSSRGGAVRKLAETQVGGDRFVFISWSADSKWVAFPDYDQAVDGPSYGAAHLYLANVETAERRMLPHPAGECRTSWLPAFSPDGKSLALVCLTTFDEGAIFVEPAQGGPARKIIALEGYVLGLAWAPDSQSLVYSIGARGIGGNLWRVRVNGGTAERLPVTNASVPAISRSGERLAYVEFREAFNVWRLELQTPARVRLPGVKLLPSTMAETSPRISPDGRHLAFESDRSGYQEIWLSEPDGSNPVQLTFFSGPATGTVRWAPDSRHVVFDSRAGGRSHLYILDIESRHAERLSTGTDEATEPFWSADGHWIYFSTETPPGVWKVPAAGGNATRIADYGLNPQESADGARVYFARGADLLELWWAPSSGGPSHRVEGLPTLVSSDHWAPSKKGIYYANGKDSPATLNLFDPLTRQSSRISTLRGDFHGYGPGLDLSQDERSVFYVEKGPVECQIMLAERFRLDSMEGGLAHPFHLP